MSLFTLDEVVGEGVEARRAGARLGLDLPEAYLRDRVHLDTLAAFSRAVGREPRFPSPGLARFAGGIPIYLDAGVAPDVLELRWPDGRVIAIPIEAVDHGLRARTLERLAQLVPPRGERLDDLVDP